MSAPANLTLEEIGRLAGVSRSTVSRVLNDHPDVRAEVRTRVHDVIERTGYLPNQAARALVSNRTGLVALVMPTDVDELFGDPYYSALVRGIQEGCLAHGSILSIFPVEEGASTTNVLATLVAPGVADGVIVTAGVRSDRLISTLRDRGKNLVVVGHPSDDRGVKRIDVENREGSAGAVVHLAGLGRRRIGFIGPSRGDLYGVERLQGYRDGLERAGLPFDDRLVEAAPTTESGGALAIGRLIDRGVAIDAVHVATDAMAAGVLGELARRGLDVPADVAVVGFDGLRGADATRPELSTVVQPVERVGATAVRLLVEEASERDGVVLFPTRLRVAASSDPAGTDPAARTP